MAKPYYAQFVCCQYTDQDEVLANGVVNDWLCHELDRHALLGPLRLIDFHADQLRADLSLLSWVSGCRIHIHSDMIARQFVRRVLIVGENETTEWILRMSSQSSMNTIATNWRRLYVSPRARTRAH